MRTASTQYQANLSRSLEFNQDKLARLTQQMSSGKKIELPSDDPLTNVRISRLNREEAVLDQYRENIATVKVRLQGNETYLSSMVVDMNAARDQLVWALDGSNTSADLNSMVNSLTTLRDSLFYNANMRDPEGHYMFSGTLTGNAPLAYNMAAAVGSRYSYVGNSGQQLVTVGSGITQATNVNVQGMETLLNQLDAAIAQLQAPGVSPNNPAVRTVLSTALDGLDTTIGGTAQKIATLGGAQTILATLDSNHANVSLSNKMAMTDLGQLDYSVAATALTGYQTALQATYQAYSRISKLSLFDAL
jgi:flagellar hook-associated protein 3 FlgL